MIENRKDFEDGVLLTKEEWRKKGYKIIVRAKFVEGEDGKWRYSCNGVCRLKPAKTAEMTENEWLECGYVIKEGAFGREMHYYSQNGIFIYTKEEAEKNEEKAKEILEQKRIARNKRQRELRKARKQRKQKLEEDLKLKQKELRELRSTFDEKQEKLEEITKTVRNKKYKIVSVAFDKYNSYDFVTDGDLDEYLEGEKIDIPGYDTATIVGTREGTLRYELVYPDHFCFRHYYKTVDGIDVELENYATDEKTKAFKEQMRKDCDRYDFLIDWCEELEGKLWTGDY